jgi:branched-chain amino acid transport system permease protein
VTTIHRRERIDRGLKARSDDIFAIAYREEALYLLLPRVMPVALLLLLPLFLPPYWVGVVTLACIFAILALSWDLMHSVGMISLGQALFFGIGSYFAGALNLYAGLPPVLAIPAATVAGGLLSTLILMPVLRLRGIYFAMVTVTLSGLVPRIIEATGFLGGTIGLSGLSHYPNMWVEVYTGLAVVIILLFGFRRLMSSDYGLILRGIAENDRAVLRGGISVVWYKTQALFIGSTVAAFAGAFTAFHTHAIGISSFAMDFSILPVAAVCVGGSGSFAGAVIGTFLLVPLSESLRAFVGLRVAVYAAIMVTFIIALPEGVFHFLQRRYHKQERTVGVDSKK